MAYEPEPQRPGYALVKYGIILVIVIVVLWFLVQYILPLFTGDRGDGQPETGPTAMVMVR